MTAFETEFTLPEAKIQRMENTWAGPFRSEILPVLLEMEPEFAHKFHPTLGAPNKPIAVMLGIKILQHTFDMSNREVYEQFDFNSQWHYALETEPDRAYVCLKTLYNYEQLIKTDDLAKAVFEKSAKSFIEKYNIHTSHQRLDSTHILSNMAKLSRLGLFTKTIEQFLKKLKRKNPGAFESIPASLRERYMDREGYFADVKASKAQRRLTQCAKDIHTLIEKFSNSEKITRLQAYKNLARLFDEQCELQTPEAPEADIDGEKPESEKPENKNGNSEKKEPNAQRVVLKEPKKVPSDSLQNPSDPDATYSGYKGKGYQAQIIETCHEENAFEVITCVEVEGAHESDQNAPGRIHENLIARGLKPETTYADTGYVSGDNIIEAEQQGIDLQGPIAAKKKSSDDKTPTEEKTPQEDNTPLSDFEFNTERTRIKKCPAGHEPVKQRDSKSRDSKPSQENRSTIAHFNKEVCDQCAQKTTCQSTEQIKFRMLRFTPSDVAVAQRRVEQETAEFKTAYKIRSGIEATNSHLKNDRGMDRLHQRGSPNVSFSVLFKCIAENAHRVVRHIQKEVKKAQKAPVTT